MASSGGSDPVSRLLGRDSLCKEDEGLQIPGGIVPEMMFELKSRTSNLEQLARESGIDPVRLL